MEPKCLGLKELAERQGFEPFVSPYDGLTIVDSLTIPSNPKYLQSLFPHQNSRNVSSFVNFRTSFRTLNLRELLGGC